MALLATRLQKSVLGTDIVLSRLGILHGCGVFCCLLCRFVSALTPFKKLKLDLLFKYPGYHGLSGTPPCFNILYMTIYDNKDT